MQITITGPRGCGKTTIAMMIAEMLDVAGQIVTYRANTRAQERAILAVREVPTADRLTHCAEITIVDMGESEDERAVQSRKEVAK